MTEHRVAPARLIGTLAGFGAIAGFLIVAAFQWAQPRILASKAAVLKAAVQEITPNRMKNYIMRLARDLGVPVTIRRVPGGVIFWRSTVEDEELAQEIAERLQGAQRRPQAHPRGRPRQTR